MRREGLGRLYPTPEARPAAEVIRAGLGVPAVFCEPALGSL